MSPTYRQVIETTVVAGLAAAFVTTGVEAQTTYSACRVPDVGAIYMIGVEGAPEACLDPSHVQFSWTEGGAVGEGAIGTAQLADGAVTSVKLAGDVTVGVEDGSIGSNQLAEDAVRARHISPGEVLSSHIGNGSIRREDLGNNSVASGEILNSTIQAEDLRDGAVTGPKISTGAVGSSEIADNSVSLADMNTNAVGTFVLVDGAVTNTKLAADAVNSSHIEDGSVEEDDVRFPVAVSLGHVSGDGATCSCLNASVIVEGDVRHIAFDGAMNGVAFDPTQHMIFITSINGRWGSWITNNATVTVQLFDEAGNPNPGEFHFVIYRR